MLLFFCLWQQDITQSVLLFLSWTILHSFLTACLTHVTLTGHVGNCCSKTGVCVISPCRQRILESVRGLLDVSYASLITIWAAYLLATSRMDLESHAFLYCSALGYHVYAVFWTLRDFLMMRHRDVQLHKYGLVYTFKNKMLYLIQCFLSIILVATGLCALSHEMGSWKNSSVSMFKEMYATVPYNHPKSYQTRAIAHHLLTKSSDVAPLLTSNLLIHELPNIFFNMIKLFRLSSYKTNHLNYDILTNGKKDSARSLGAWSRERGIINPPLMQTCTLEDALSKLHRITFVFVRVLGGFLTLSRILQMEILVRDTLYVASALLYHGIAIYLFGGIVAYTAKRSGSKHMDLKKSFSWQLATAVSDDWLHYS